MTVLFVLIPLALLSALGAVFAFHHEREVGILFPAMAKLGYAPDGAPLAHIRDEHVRERHLLFELRQVAVRTSLEASAKKAHDIGVVQELIAFEREHIQKENDADALIRGYPATP